MLQLNADIGLYILDFIQDRLHTDAQSVSFDIANPLILKAVTQFIVFHTLNQAKNYIKRHRPKHFSDGCGCCWTTNYYEIQDNKVLYRNYGESKGRRYYTVRIIGKIKGVGVITPIAV